MFYQYAIAIVIIHFIGDWLFQSRKMGDNKSKFTAEGWRAWGSHILVYFATLYIGMVSFNIMFNPMISINTCIDWAFLNAAIHGIQDKITSNITHRLYEEKKYHGFFTVIGFDGMLHYLCLFISTRYMFGV
jgi:hypothetical protein